MKVIKRLDALLVQLQQYYANLSTSFVTYLIGAVVNLTATYAMMVLLLNVCPKRNMANMASIFRCFQCY
jgi:hypothetical protein